MTGPLSELRVIELGGVGPVPFAAMVLADLGADVVRIDRVGRGQHEFDDDAFRRKDVLARGRRSLAVDLKHEAGREVVLRLAAAADILIEGFRPGIAERLGVGPDDCFSRNEALVYARMTGWGQSGAYAAKAGHDINYIGVAGVLEGVGRAGEPPTLPLNYVGDFGGGAMVLAVGALAAVIDARRSGIGQVIDAAMVDGAALLNAGNYAMHAYGWDVRRGHNRLSGAAPHYNVYECSDGGWITIGANESAFYGLFRRVLGLDDDAEWEPQDDEAAWPRRRDILTERFKARTRDEWCEFFEGVDVCFAPVFDLVQAASDRHMTERATIVEREGVLQPSPAPRFSRTPATLNLPPPLNGQHTDEVMAAAGYAAVEIEDMCRDGVVARRAKPGS